VLSPKQPQKQKCKVSEVFEPTNLAVSISGEPSNRILSRTDHLKGGCGGWATLNGNDDNATQMQLTNKARASAGRYHLIWRLVFSGQRLYWRVTRSAKYLNTTARFFAFFQNLVLWVWTYRPLSHLTTDASFFECFLRRGCISFSSRTHARSRRHYRLHQPPTAGLGGSRAEIKMHPAFAQSCVLIVVAERSGRGSDRFRAYQSPFQLR
jgi:hypothetical protein